MEMKKQGKLHLLLPVNHVSTSFNARIMHSTYTPSSIERSMLVIPGTRIDLRPVRAVDLTQLRQWEHDPQIAKLMATTATVLDTRESVEQEFDRLLRAPRIKLLTIQTKEGAVIGFIRLNDIDWLARKATLRLFVAPEMQGQGYGTDALHTLARFCFRELGLHRLGLVVRVDNTRAINVYKRLGYVVEGCERDAAWVEGCWVDFLHMGLLAHEWKEEALG
jgi:RimJ/RimL family protein N-acetyltransferase